MHTRNAVLLLGAGIVLVLAAWWLHDQRRAGGLDEDAGEEARWFLGEAREQVEDVTRIEIRRGEDRLVAVRAGEEDWRAPEHHGHPLRFDDVRKFLRGLTGLRDPVAKTSDPQKHAQLQLAAAGEDAGTLVRLWTGEDASEEEPPLIALWLGRSRFSPTQAVYLRRDGEDQTWMCEGRVTPQHDELRWMDTQVVRLPATDLAAVSIRGDVDAEITRADADASWELAGGPPAGKEPAGPRPFAAITAALSWVSFDRVAPAGDERFAREPDRVLRYATFDGGAVEVELWREEPDEDAADFVGSPAWIRLSVTPSPTPAGKPGAEEATESAEEPEGEGEQATDAGEEEEESATIPAEQAEEWRARWDGWIYRVPAAKAEVLLQTSEDWLQDAEPEEEPEEEAGEEVMPQEDGSAPQGDGGR